MKGAPCCQRERVHDAGAGHAPPRGAAGSRHQGQPRLLCPGVAVAACTDAGIEGQQGGPAIPQRHSDAAAWQSRCQHISVQDVTRTAGWSTEHTDLMFHSSNC